MPRTVCQLSKQRAGDIVSLCAHCSAQDDCSDTVAIEVIRLTGKKDHGKIQIVEACSRFQPFAGSFFRHRRDLTARLQEAEIVDLCMDCPSAEKVACSHFAQTDALARIALHEGRRFKLAVIGCHTVLRGQDCQKLHQIAEPGELGKKP